MANRLDLPRQHFRPIRTRPIPQSIPRSWIPERLFTYLISLVDSRIFGRPALETIFGPAAPKSQFRDTARSIYQSGGNRPVVFYVCTTSLYARRCCVTWCLYGNYRSEESSRTLAQNTGAYRDGTILSCTSYQTNTTNLFQNIYPYNSRHQALGQSLRYPPLS